MSPDAAVGFERHLDELEQMRCTALRETDIQRLTELLHPDFVYVHASGRTENRTEYLTAIADPRTTYGDFVHQEVGITALGTGALMGGVLSHSKTADGHSRSLLFRFTAVWVGHGGDDWRLLRWHNTKIVPHPAVTQNGRDDRV